MDHVSRKRTWMGNINLSKNRQESLLVFHGFTVNDYVSIFFKNGKVTCLKTLLKHSQHKNKTRIKSTHQF